MKETLIYLRKAIALNPKNQVALLDLANALRYKSHTENSEELKELDLKYSYKILEKLLQIHLRF